MVTKWFGLVGTVFFFYPFTCFYALLRAFTCKAHSLNAHKWTAVRVKKKVKKCGNKISNFSQVLFFFVFLITSLKVLFCFKNLLPNQMLESCPFFLEVPFLDKSKNLGLLCGKKYFAKNPPFLSFIFSDFQDFVFQNFHKGSLQSGEMKDQRWRDEWDWSKWKWDSFLI